MKNLKQFEHDIPNMIIEVTEKPLQYLAHNPLVFDIKKEELAVFQRYDREFTHTCQQPFTNYNRN